MESALPKEREQWRLHVKWWMRGPTMSFRTSGTALRNRLLRAPRSPPVRRGTAMAADRYRPPRDNVGIARAGVLLLVAVLLPLLAVVATPTPAQAATVVCVLYCDPRDPSLARQESFPVPERN